MKRLLLAVLLCAACGTAPRVAVNPHPAPHDMGFRREQWMFDQRAYPFGSIPAEARRNALKETQRFRPAGNAVGAAAGSQAYWRSIGPQPVHTNWSWRTSTGRVKTIAISPADPNLVLAGSSSGGIWRSIDAGRTFAPVTDEHADLAVGSIAFAPSNPNIVYAAMGSDFLGTGMLRSDDAGAHWRLVSGSTYGSRGMTPRMIIHPSDANRLWVAQYSRLNEQVGETFSSGFLSSMDGGVTWSRLFGGLTSDLVAAPDNTSTFLLGVTRRDGTAGNAGIYRTEDGGTTWSLIVDATAQTFAYPRLAVTRSAPERVYAHMYSTGPAGNKYRFLSSSDGGKSFQDVAATGLPEEFAFYVQADPADKQVVYVGMRDLYKSTDGGLTFVNTTRGYSSTGRFTPEASLAHVDQHALAFHPHDSGTLFLGNDGGVFVSRDAASTFSSLSAALSVVQAYSIAAHPDDPTTLFLGTQDNGLTRLNASGAWRELFTGDYGSVLFDRDNPQLLATNYVEGVILSFNSLGDSFRGTLATNTTFGGNRVAFIAPFEQHLATNTLFFGTYQLFLSRDFGTTWVAPAQLDLTRGGTDTLGAIGVAASNPQVIYTGSNRGRVMMTRDGGTTWSEIMNGLPNRAVRCFAVDRVHADTAYIGFSGYAAAHVWKTEDGGASWRNVSAGLPDAPVNALLLDPSNPNILYAGSDIGVFRYDARNDSWEPFSRGMPPVIVADFDITADGRLVAATHGRGAYELVMAPTAARRRGVRH